MLLSDCISHTQDFKWGWHIEGDYSEIKVAKLFCETFPECSLPGTVSKNAIQKDRSTLLLRRCNGQILPHLYPIPSIISQIRTTFCSGWKQRLLKEYLKNIDRKKVPTSKPR